MHERIQLYSMEENLLREIETTLQMFFNRSQSGEPLRAAEVMTSIPTEKLATIMAWAQIGLRDYVLCKNRALEGDLVSIKPITIPFQEPA